MSDENEDKELWKKLLQDTGPGLSPERREHLDNERQKVADDHDITPVEAFNRGVTAGVEVATKEILDRLDTIEAASLPQKPKDGAQ
jgi:hypothetical protein